MISIWRWTDSTWVDLDTRQVGTDEVEVAGLGPSGSQDAFVSGATGLGDVRVRGELLEHRGVGLRALGDLLKLVV